jgi:drug/metabolite transporter (DMT)-like permease
LSVAARWLDTSFGIFTQVYIRIFLAMVATIIIFPRDIRWGNIKALNIKDWLVLLLMGIVGYGLMIFAITKGALITTLLNVSVLFSTVPIFVYLLGVIFLKRRWRYIILGLLLVSIWGVGVLSSGQFIPAYQAWGW